MATVLREAGFEVRIYTLDHPPRTSTSGRLVP